jgi:hypothetical protein
MDVICKHGRHFPDLQAARGCADNHQGGCGQCDGIDLYSSLKETRHLPEETQAKTNARDTITQQSKIIQSRDECPDPKRKKGDCPRCRCSKSISERRKFLNVTTWWLCYYPKIVNLRAFQPEDLDDI